MLETFDVSVSGNVTVQAESAEAAEQIVGDFLTLLGEEVVMIDFHTYATVTETE